MYSIQFSTCIYFLKWKHFVAHCSRYVPDEGIKNPVYVSLSQLQELKLSFCVLLMP